MDVRGTPRGGGSPETLAKWQETQQEHTPRLLLPFGSKEEALQRGPPAAPAAIILLIRGKNYLFPLEKFLNLYSAVPVSSTEEGRCIAFGWDALHASPAAIAALSDFEWAGAF